jgi:mxaL protein
MKRSMREIFRGWSRERWLLLIAAVALAATVASPSAKLQQNVFDLLVVVDITQSMNTLDYELDGRPASRLVATKYALRQALPQLPCGSKMGMGIFTEYRTFLLFTPVEVCANYSELSTAIDTIDGRMAWAGGSEIAKGLYSGLLTAKAIEGTPALVFITDGHEAPPLNLRHRPEFTGQPGEVKGIIVGSGGTRPRPIPKFDLEGNPLGFWKADEVLQTYNSSRGGSANQEEMVETEPEPELPQLKLPAGSEHLSALREDYLKLLAVETKLGYLRLTARDGLLGALTDRAFARPAEVTTDLRWIPALIALLSLVAAYLPRLSWRRHRSSEQHAASRTS